MPAARLPWFRFWVGATANGKVRTLDDATFRTWVELLDAASQQPRRGRFASRAEAAAITRRPAKHIAALITARLIDETPEGLTMHDWDDWQRWRKEDANDTGTTPESPPDDHMNDHRNGHTNNTRTTTERPTDHQRRRLRARVDRDTERDRDVDIDRDTERDVIPPVANATSPQGARRRVTQVDDDFRSELENEYCEALGSRQAVRDVMDEAMSHSARAKRSDQRAYLRNWVRRDAEAAARRRNGTRAALAVVESDCNCEFIHDCDAKGLRNGPRICPEHGFIERPDAA